MDHHSQHLEERRSAGFRAWVFRFFIENHKIMAFVAGWSAYPIGAVLLSLLMS